MTEPLVWPPFAVKILKWLMDRYQQPVAKRKGLWSSRLLDDKSIHQAVNWLMEHEYITTEKLSDRRIQYVPTGLVDQLIEQGYLDDV